MQRPSEKPERFELDGEQVVGINTRLRESKVAMEEYAPLAENRGHSFQGPIPAGAFYLDRGEAEAILARGDAPYEEVVRPYLIGDDITEEPEQKPRRFVVDFGMRSLEEAMKFPDAIRFVRERVKPTRDENNREAYRRYWWRFAEPRPKMRRAIEPLSRYIAGNRIGKRFLFCWAEASVCPSDLTIVFAFDDDYSMGVLTSSTHGAWAHSESSTLRVDLRYTPTSCFETFPWPQAVGARKDEIGSVVRQLIERRQAICVEQGIGLTDLYNRVEEGAWSEVAELHRRLDGAVARAYGWEPAVARDPLEIKARLAKLHGEILAGEPYEPF